MSLAVYLPVAFLIVAFEDSGRYLEATAVTVVAVLVLVAVMALPGRRLMGPAELWAAGHDVDRLRALEGTYAYARKTSFRTVWATGVRAAMLSVAVGATAGATASRLLQYAILGAVVGTGSN